MQSSQVPFAAGPCLKAAAEDGVAVSGAVFCGRTLIGLLTARPYPIAGTLAIGGLMPGRYYHVRGAGRGFCRADEAGEALLSIALTEPTPVVIEPVI